MTSDLLSCHVGPGVQLKMTAGAWDCAFMKRNEILHVSQLSYARYACEVATTFQNAKVSAIKEAWKCVDLGDT